MIRRAVPQRLASTGYGYEIVNASVSGETTSGGLQQCCPTLFRTQPIRGAQAVAEYQDGTIGSLSAVSGDEYPSDAERPRAYDS